MVELADVLQALNTSQTISLREVLVHIMEDLNEKGCDTSESFLEEVIVTVIDYI